jgi:uncharacterized protein YacL
VVSFLILSVIFGLILRALGVVNKIPILGMINRTAGAVLGLLVAAVILYVLAQILEIIAARSPGDIAFLSQTHIAKYVYDFLIQADFRSGASKAVTTTVNFVEQKLK